MKSTETIYQKLEQPEQAGLPRNFHVVVFDDHPRYARCSRSPEADGVITADIAAESPAEIAVAIVSEISMSRDGAMPRRSPMRFVPAADAFTGRESSGSRTELESDRL
ncbi:MAG: hypothetical protein M5U01_31530 [Ardenticatenaceae bacterium]|nr:hypothetical protein [Ardenticatenaceae bacterium]